MEVRSCKRRSDVVEESETVDKRPAGVYIAMNGRYFHWNNVRKNKKTGQFEEMH
jgi:hypothetical protein